MQTSEEASCLCKLTILFYGFRDAKKELLLQRFTHMTEEFNHLDLVAELEASYNDPRSPFVKKG